MLDRRTRSLDESENAPLADGGVGPKHALGAMRTNGAEATADTQPISGLASSTSETLDASGPPVSLAHALRAARTPLIPGVDFRTIERYNDAQKDATIASDRFNNERPRVDTLSPLESVPPPAPYPLEPPPQRPSIVPPVRLGYQEPPAQRAEGYLRSSGIRSDPPPRIPITDRPSRPAYRSEPPPRYSRSDPPPPSSGRKSDNGRNALFEVDSGGDASQFSFAAQRREAVTIPADTNSPSVHANFDGSQPLPPLRVPTFSGLRQHENSRLRNVAMAMMFVIFIVTGAIAGMRWYVSHDDASVTAPEVVAPREQHIPRTRLDRLAPNAVVAPRDSGQSPVSSADREINVSATPKPSRIATGPAKPNRSGTDLRPVVPGDPTQVPSPWSKRSGVSSSASALRKPAADTRKPGKNRVARPSDAQIPLVPD